MNQPVAITGMACRFPGAPSLAEFWRLLCEGRHGIGPVPAERWDADAMFDQDAKARGKINTRHGGFIDAVDRFDAAFFGISPREATQMDPQQRILLELAYLALEDAGICPERLAGTDASVFVGAMTNEYMRHQLAEGYNRVDVHTGSGAGLCMLANRLSYQFDLRGPSVAVDTACSSSLVAVFQACQSLWTGQSRLAIAAGVNVMLDPAFNVFYGKAGLSAPDGKCKTFSAAANGIGRAEGAGVVILKRLQDALADNDPIYAVIRGGAVNHDGRSNGLTQPNRWAQEQLLRSAFENARVDAKELEYIELHGTGTLIGDPIEANAIGSVLTESGARANPCLVGSVKTNLGHLEAAAGIAGLIKLALSVHHGEIPQSLWFDAPNPHIAFDRIPIRVNTERTPWPGRDGKRLSGISSFGLGGTNTHLVVEAAPSQKGVNSRHENAHYHLFLSARSEAALRELAGGYVEFLATTSDADLAVVCSTAMTRKGVHDYRLSVLGENGAALITRLRAFIAGEQHVDVVHGRYRPAHRRLVIALSEHERIDARMAANWFAQMPVARAAWNECQHLFCEQGIALLPSVEELAARSDMCAGDKDFRAWHFAIQYALLKQLRTSVRLAESIKCINAEGLGQLAALCTAEAISLDAAVRWLKADLSPDFISGFISGPDSSAAGYSIACECTAGKNPAPVAIDWRPSRRSLEERLAADHAHADTDIVLIKLNRLPELDADRSATSEWIASEDDYGFQRVFARLALCYQLEWSALADDNGFVRLPAYRWQRDSFWLSRNVAAELNASANDLGGDSGGDLRPANAAKSVSNAVVKEGVRYALLGTRLDAPTPCWENRLSTAMLKYLPDHRVQGLMVLPGSGYIELGLAVHREVTAAERGVLENVEFHKALVIEDDHEPLMRVTYDETTRTYSVYTQQRRAKQWDLHARGRLSLLPPAMPAAVDLDSLKNRCTEVIEGVTHYEDMCERGFGYGPYFQGVRQLWFNREGDEVLAWVQSDQALSETGRLARLHPAIFDACLQTLLTPLGAKGDDELYIPVGIRQVRLFSTPESGFWVHGILHQVARGSVEGEVTLFAEDGQVIAEARGVRASVLTQKQSDELKHLDRWLYQFSWQDQSVEFTEGNGRGRWLVFADSYGASRTFIEQLKLAGADEIVEVLPGTAYERCSATQFHIDAHGKEDLRRVLQSNPDIAGIVYLWGTDTSNEECPLAGSMSRAVPVVNLLQILSAEYGDRPPSLSIVTRRAQSVGVHEQTESAVQSPLIGLVRVAVNEYPKQRLRAIDIDADAATLQSLAREVLSESAEDEVALRGAERFVQRMLRSPSFATSELERQAAELALQEVDVALKVAAVDRMTAASNSPSPSSLGECEFEGLGTVSRIGGEVSQVGSGDEVYVCLSGPLRANILAPASCVIPIAAENAAVVSERAGQIAAFITAYYALHRVARLQSGETLFIHEAATPTGLAAIQVAQWLGVRVYATAADDRQREHLQSLSLAGVVDGSLPDCVDRVVDRLEVRGLDAVFNTISGEIASHAFAALLPGGRFIDVASAENVHAIANVAAPGSAQANRSVSSVDIRRLMAEQPRVFAELLDRVCERFSSGDFAGIPEQVFSAAESAAAMTAANASDRIGTVAVRFDAGTHRPAGLQAGSFRQDGSYLITGGCGGFGLEIAAWMVEQGARDIALVGRRGAHTLSAQQAVEKLRKRGARVLVIAADIGDESAVERVIATIEREMTPLRGVFHAAAALDDAPIAQLEPQQIENAFAAKARGAWHLHRHTFSRQLDHFVLFSSIAAMVGGAGQASYAMSCIYLDALARHRRGLGLPAISVNWGALSEVGMAARYGDAQQHLNRSGVGSFTPRQAVKLFGRVLHWNPVEMGVANMDWKSWGETYPAFAKSPKYSALHVVAEAAAQSKSTAVVQALLAVSPDARLPIVMQHLTGLLAATLTTTPEEIDCGLSLLSLGVDSLMAMEFQAAIDKDFGIKIPTLELMKGNSLTQLGEQLAKAIDVAVDPAASADKHRGPVSLDELDIEGAEHFIASLDALAEDELDRLLATVMPHEELRV